MNSDCLISNDHAVQKIQTTRLKMIPMIRIFTFSKRQYVNLIFSAHSFLSLFHFQKLGTALLAPLTSPSSRATSHHHLSRSHSLASPPSISISSDLLESHLLLPSCLASRNLNTALSSRANSLSRRKGKG